MSVTILIVGNDTDDRDVILRALDTEPYRVLATDNSEEAEPRASQRVDLVIADLQASNLNALDLLREWRVRKPGTAFVVVTNDGDVASAVEAMKLGAADCVVKPIDGEELRMLVAKVIETHMMNPDAADEEPRGRRGRVHIEIPPGTSLEDLERAAVEQALTQHHGNRTHAAKTLGISVRTLQRKLKTWGMPLATQSPMPQHSFLLPPAHTSAGFTIHAH